MSVGYNNFDLKAMKKRNIIGTHTPNVLNDTVADLTFGLMLATARRIAEWDTYLKNGKWERTKSDERSEERRVGKECRSRRSRDQERKREKGEVEEIDRKTERKGQE